MKNIVIYLLLLLFAGMPSVFSQKNNKTNTSSLSSVDASLLKGLEYRLIGPFRGGRSAAVTGVVGQPNVFYFGSTGGGIFKSTDGGNSWASVSDGFFGGSIGAIAVSEWDPNVIYVGGGEVTVRGNVSYGNGMFKSVDAGKTWKSIGLPESKHIVRIAIHPKNPDVVYAAVLGDLFKPSKERGIYKSIDGGASWKQILFANENAGAVELAMDPSNPRNLFASTWRVRRTPYSLESGGEGSALWQSTDGGETWKNITANEGLPKGTWGISGVTVSGANSNRVWAIIENKDGGVYRSENAGKTWKLVNKSRELRQRAWYYSKIYADPKNEDMVYVMNVDYHRSKDGGVTFEAFEAPHGDHHDLWIAPEDPLRMIIADDGGGQVSYDGGENWSTYENQPTAQFYRVVTDNSFPYRIYGAQQDNSTVRIKHRSDNWFIGDRDWEETAGGESAHIAVDPLDNDLVYGGSYGGFLTRVNHKTNEIRAINVWPDNPMGYGAEGMKYRFQWNFPILFSPNDPKKLYAASNHLHVSTDEGQSWKIISPDLTRNDPSKLGPSGGSITKDNTGVEYYCTIFAVAESTIEAGVIWTGSDDGLIHLTKDNGSNWQNVTPPSMPQWTMINSISVDPFEKGGAYIAATSYKSGDYQPYLFKTKDYGKSWQKITNGINNQHFTRVVRPDPDMKGLLYAGTESGMYVSFDDGAVWQSLQLNLPIVPITDLCIKEKNLIVATQGRSFWIIDDLSVIHQLAGKPETNAVKLFKPLDSYRLGGGNGRTSKTEGTNHPGGVLVHYYVKDTSNSDTLKIVIKDTNGQEIRTFSSHADDKKKETKLKIVPGINRINWDMRYNGAVTFPGMILWAGMRQGAMAVPGVYNVTISYKGTMETHNFELKKDPRSSVSQSDLQAQFDFIQKCQGQLSQANQTILDIREIKKQINHVTEKIGKSNEGLSSAANEIIKKLSDVENELYQTKNESGQDPLNFPIKLNNKVAALASLSSIGSYKPTDQSLAFYEEVSGKIQEQIKRYNEIVESDIKEFNSKVFDAKIEAVKLKP